MLHNAYLYVVQQYALPTCMVAQAATGGYICGMFLAPNAVGTLIPSSVKKWPR
jgi:hypothetical protein